MQSAIVEAFKSILPTDSSAGATPPAAASPSAKGSIPPVDVPSTRGPPALPIQPLHGQAERPPTQTQANVLQHRGPMSEGAVAEQTSGPQGLLSSLHPARPPHAKAPVAGSLPAAVPIAVASLTALPGDHAQALPAQMDILPVQLASQQPQAPCHPPHDLSQGAKPSRPLPAVVNPDAVAFSSTAPPSKRAPMALGSDPGLLPAPPTTAEAAQAAANAARLKTAAAAATAATPTAAVRPSAAAKPVAMAAASSQAPLDTLGSKKGITASTDAPLPSKAVMPQLAPIAATLTAAAKPLPSIAQALPVIGSMQPPSATVPVSSASMAAGVGNSDPPAPTQPLGAPVGQGQATSIALSKGSSAPPGGETRDLSLVSSLCTASGTASGTAPESQGRISATAVTPSATAPPPPATAAAPPAIPSSMAVTPPAAAATLPATAATPPAIALTASTPAASQPKNSKPSAGLGTAGQVSVGGSLGGVKADSEATGRAAKGDVHSTALSAVMVTQGLAPPAPLNPSRGQAHQLPVNLTAALGTSTVPALLPPDLSTGAPPVGAPAFSLFSRELSRVPQLPVDLTPSATAHANPGTAAAVGVSPDLNPGFPRTQLGAPPVPSAAAAERPFQFPANPASSPAPASLTPPASQGFAGIPASPSLFSPPQAAGAAKKKSSKASRKRKAEQQAVPSSVLPKSGARQPSASADKKRKAESQAIPSPLPPHSGAKQSPAVAATTTAAALAGLPSRMPDSAAKHPPSALSPNPKRHQPGPNSRDSFEFVSPELTAMLNAHGNCPFPMVGAHAVRSHLADVKSLVTDSTHKYSLKDIINAVGQFAVGRQQQQEIFLGDLHNSIFHQQQVGLHFFRCCCSSAAASSAAVVYFMAE